MLHRTLPLTSAILTLFLPALALAEDAIRPGEYHAPAGSGTLTFKPGENHTHRFRIYAEGVNGHVCEVEGTLAAGKSQVSLPTEEGPCLIRFQPLADGYQVAVPDEAFNACSTFCGARASFAQDYWKVETACLPKAIRKSRADFKKAYTAKDFDKAKTLLEPLLGKCVKNVDLQPRAFIRNDLAITLHHLGDDAGCLKVLEPLADYARKTDEQVVDGIAPIAVEDELRIARATRTNFKLCSAPKLEDNLSALVGRTFDDIGEIDATLVQGAFWTVQGDLGVTEYDKPTWKPTKHSRGKMLLLSTQTVDPRDKRNPQKILDVLWIDLDRFPAGVANLSTGPSCEWKGKPDVQVLGVFPSKNADKGVVPYKAWYTDSKTGKFVELPPKNVRCAYDNQG